MKIRLGNNRNLVDYTGTDFEVEGGMLIASGGATGVGIQGATGVRGLTGPAGAVGASGVQGIQGQTGPAGTLAAGVTGLVLINGVTGTLVIL